MERERQAKQTHNDETMLTQLLERRKKYNLTMTDIVSIVTDLIIGGVDTVS